MFLALAAWVGASIMLSWGGGNATNSFCSWGFLGDSDSKESACNAGNLGSIPGLGRFPGEGHGNPLEYSCLENPMDRGAWRAIVYGITKSLARLKKLNMHYYY